ncbi:hypothetical protein M422DRAFT_62703 [Sphaerobolus stellatus SS14]|nr:hypothetical protein M422DRAFT_62703 [Sphaerobolus stellatus SS14]
MSSALKALRLPRLSQAAILNDTPEYADQIQEWNTQSLQVVQELQQLLSQEDVVLLLPEDIAVVFAISVPLSSEEQWIDGSLRVVAESLYTQLPAPTLDVITSVLTYHVKPCFIKNPHSRINVESGRKLHRAAGGSAGVTDFYEDQEWKNYPWIGHILHWCIKHLNSEDYERLWPLVIPPSMTLLDDYEIYSKLNGVWVISEMLVNVPPILLKRTGIDGLLKTVELLFTALLCFWFIQLQSLKSTTLHLHSPLTPQLIRTSIPAFITLTNITTTDGSRERFDELSTLLGDNILGGIWLYAYNEYATLEVSILALPAVLEELGIGSVRFLKPIISQLIHNITEVPTIEASCAMQVASVALLEFLMNTYCERIFHWSGFIAEGFARCWVALQESSLVSKTVDLRQALKQACATLMEVCPSVVQNEYKQLLSCDSDMFGRLLPTTIMQQC